MRFPKNIPASVWQRLLNRAKNDRRPFSELLQYYAMERFLYRLSQSVYADRFILKGALMLRVWRSPELRPTMDIGMLGRTSNKEVEIVERIRDILTADVVPDGLDFDPDSIQAERIMESRIQQLHEKSACIPCYEMQQKFDQNAAACTDNPHR
jgi:hypothetical protein